MLAERPQLKYLMLHNIDTLGADVDPVVLGQHIASGACLSFEVITRRLEDRGGGLARRRMAARAWSRASPCRARRTEFALTYYNTLTTWIDLDLLLQAFGLTRADFALGAESEEKIREAIRTVAARMPTYITLKDVKKRWGHGQEDVFPVTQFEKLWGDMTRPAGARHRAIWSSRATAASSSKTRRNSTAGCAMGRRRLWSRSVRGSSMSARSFTQPTSTSSCHEHHGDL